VVYGRAFLVSKQCDEHVTALFSAGRNTVFPDGRMREDAEEEPHDLDARHGQSGKRYENLFPAAEFNLADRDTFVVLIADDLAHH